MNVRALPPSVIRTDGGTQPRAAIYRNVVDDYAEAVLKGATFPPVTIFYDGSDYWLADGFHRVAAYSQAKAEAIPVDIRQGTRRDAILHSVGANNEHGLRRTNKDKRRAVMTLLADHEWSGWSNCEIARRCGVSDPFVMKLRERSLLTVRSDERTYTDKHGNLSTMNTGAIGKTPPSQAFDPVQAQEILDQAKAIRAKQVEEKRSEKIAETERISVRNTKLPQGQRKYSVIYADRTINRAELVMLLRRSIACGAMIIAEL